LPGQMGYLSPVTDSIGRSAKVALQMLSNGASAGGPCGFVHELHPFD
jgi:hypothetical protein